MTAAMAALIALSMLLVIGPRSAMAQDKALNGVALVIGQSAYEHITPLPNPVNDARDMVKLLTDLGFDARSVSDRDSRKLKRDLERFVEDAEGADVALLYYSGHGIEAAGENWLLPVDADTSSLENASETLVPLSEVLDDLKNAAPVTIILLDACRTNPFPPGTLMRVTSSGSAEPIGDGGLTPVRGAKAIGGDAPATDNLGTVIGFAAEPGRPALDGPSGSNSPYATALLRHLAAMNGAEFGAVMRMVTEEVYLGTSAKQRPWVNESLRRLLYFGSAPDEPTGPEATINGERRTLLLTISELPSLSRSRVELAAAKDGVPLDSLYGVLKALGTEKIPEDPTALEKILDAQAERLKEMFAQQEALRADNPKIAALSQSADRALREGAIDAARQFLDEAVNAVESDSASVDAAEEIIKQKRIADAAVYAQRAGASALAFDFMAAADDYAKASELVDRWDEKLSRQYRFKEGVASAQGGMATGDRDALERAMAAYTAALAMGSADIQRQNRPVVLNNMALVQLTLGENSTTTAELEKAREMLVEAIALAAELKDDPTWAAAQSSLGNVLYEIGSRRSDTALLEQAVVAYKAAMSYQTRETSPLEWAGLQNNMGIALYAFGSRSTDSAKFIEAEAAYRSALEEYRREIAPAEWAMVQNNLGNTLSELGFNRNEPEKIAEAVTAFRAALEVRTRELLPHSWASTRLNLASALSRQARYDMNTSLLEEAESALRDGLEIFDRREFPLDWAATQNSLGSVLQALGQRTRDTSKLEASASAFRAARRVYTRAAFPRDWAMVHVNLGNTLQVWGGVSNEPARYKEALLAYRDAMREYTKEAAPREWAIAQSAMGGTLQSLAMAEGDMKYLAESIEARRAALTVQTMEDSAIDWANTQNGLGVSLLNRSTFERKADYLDDAQAAFEAALKVFTRETQPLQWAFGQNNIGDVYWNRGAFAGDRKAYETAITYFEAAKLGFTESGFLMPIALTDQKIALVRETLASP